MVNSLFSMLDQSWRSLSLGAGMRMFAFCREVSRPSGGRSTPNERNGRMGKYSSPAFRRHGSLRHILPLPLDAGYQVRMVPCHETGSLHHHKRHREYFTTALCGAEALKDQGHYNACLLLNGLKPPRVCSSCLAIFNDAMVQADQGQPAGH